MYAKLSRSFLFSLLMIISPVNELLSQEKSVTDSIPVAVVTADKIADSSLQPGLRSISGERIGQIFATFSSPDIIKDIQNMSGVASGTELLSGMYVHGGDGSDNLFILDGIPIYQVSHIGGIFSSFNPDIIDNLNFYKSGFPARYGGRMSSVSDITSKEGSYTDYKGRFSIGLLDGRIQFEGPIVKNISSFNIAMRHSWLELLSIPGFMIHNYGKANKNSAQYRFYDFNAQVSFRPDDSNAIFLRLYSGRDVFSTEEKKKEKGYGHEIYIGYDTTDVGIQWGNLLVSTAWDHTFSSHLRSSMKLYYSGSNSRINISNYDWNFDERIEKESTAIIHDNNATQINDIGTLIDFSYSKNDRHQVKFGTSLAYHRYKPERYSSYRVSDLMEDKSENEITYTGGEFNAYAEDEIKLTSRLKANIGVRYILFFIPDKAYNSLEPRIALGYQFNDKLGARLSYNEMSQFVHLVSSTYLDLPTNIWMPSTKDMPPSRSKQISGGLYCDLPQNFHISIEGYYKYMDNLTFYAGKAGLFPPIDSWEKSFIKGKGISYGTELELGYKTDKLEANAYYTLSWSRRLFSDLYPRWFNDRNDNRHKLTLITSYKCSEVVDLYASWNIKSGGWMTIPEHVVISNVEYSDQKYPVLENLYDVPNNLEMPAYHRLDIGCNLRKFTKKGNESIWNISVYNAYCKMNPIFIGLEQTDSGRYIGKALAIIPILPSFSYTLKF